MNGKRAPKGMWRKNAWEEGARLFARSVDGRKLSVEEWEVLAINPPQMSLDF